MDEGIRNHAFVFPPKGLLILPDFEVNFMEIVESWVQGR